MQKEQLQALPQASRAIHRAQALDLTLQIVADSAREIIGARLACTLIVGGPIGISDDKLIVSPANDPAAEGMPGRDELREIAVRAASYSKSLPLHSSAPSLHLLLPACHPAPPPA